MNNLKIIIIIIIGICSAISSNYASAQYRDFKNKDGVVINALPVEKNNTSIKLRLRNGKECTLNISILSDADASFISSWKRPEYDFRVFIEPFAQSINKENACVIQISEIIPEIRQDKDPFNPNGFGCLAYLEENKREVMDVLGVFVDIIKDKENFLRKNHILGEEYSLKLLQFKNKYPKTDTKWEIDVTPEQIFLVGKTDNINKGHIKCRIKEDEAPYLLEYLDKFNSASKIREFIKLSQGVRETDPFGK